MDNGNLKAGGEVKKMDDGTVYILYPGGTRTAAQIGDQIGSALQGKTQEEAIAACSNTKECVAVHQSNPSQWHLRRAGENSFVSECCSQNQCFNDQSGMKEDCPKDCDGTSYCAGVWIYFPSCTGQQIPDGSSPNGCAAGNSRRRLHDKLVDLTATVDNLIARAREFGNRLEQ